ncbi:MAG: head-tail connector protein [Pseudomonadota bacterium]
MPKRKVITPPDGEPITLEATKSYLRIGHDHEDDLVTQLIQHARARLEAAGNLDLIAKTVQTEWRSWPKRIDHAGVKLGTSPVTALNAVAIARETGESLEVTDQFEVVQDRIRYIGDRGLPQLGRGDRVIVALQVGYADSEALPDDLKEALLRLIGAHYSARLTLAPDLRLEGGLPPNVQAILDARQSVRL